jgi:hypothetical protein
LVIYFSFPGQNGKCLPIGKAGVLWQVLSVRGQIPSSRHRSSGASEAALVICKVTVVHRECPAVDFIAFIGA